jgi:hypothetical protein
LIGKENLTMARLKFFTVFLLGTLTGTVLSPTFGQILPLKDEGEENARWIPVVVRKGDTEQSQMPRLICIEGIACEKCGLKPKPRTLIVGRYRADLKGKPGQSIEGLAVCEFFNEDELNHYVNNPLKVAQHPNADWWTIDEFRKDFAPLTEFYKPGKKIPPRRK